MISRLPFFLAILISILACFQAATALPPVPFDPAGFNEPIRVACVGDSITEGAGADLGRSYPAQLQALLGEEWQVGNFGVGGRTLLKKGDFPYWNEDAFRKAQAFQPQAVIIMLGTNDTKPQNWIYRDEFVKDYADLVKIFLALPSKPRVYVCRPVPVPEPGLAGINETNVLLEIKMLDQLLAELPVTLIDMYAALAGKPELIPDRVHPNTAGAGLMAQAAFEVLAGRKTPVASAIQTNSLFRSHAVLQRDIALPVWGTAPAGTPVTVEFAGQKVSTTARDGRWLVQLKPLAMNPKPQAMRISSPVGNVNLKDILVGDVWLAGGQSNMERELGPRPPQQNIVGATEVVAAANFPLIRQFYVPHRTSDGSVSDVAGTWSVCSPATVENFSAVGYFFARDLFQAIQIPIGILHSSWGGTPIQTWMSPEVLKTFPKYRAVLEQRELDKNKPSDEAANKEAWFAKNDPGSAVEGGWEKSEFTPTDWSTTDLPKNLTEMGLDNFRGVVWFRREIELPAEAVGQTAILHLGKLDDEDTTWVNGQLVGSKTDWQADRDYAIGEKILRAGPNIIAVRLVNTNGNGGWVSAPNDLKLEFPGRTTPASVPLNGPWTYQTTANFATVAPIPNPLQNRPNEPARLYQSMIEPLLAFPIRGAIWYQGESNSGAGREYLTLFPAMIQDWRQRWKVGSFPFLFVQIAPHKDMGADIREAQFLTLSKSPKTAMAITTDVGDAEDIHPPRKEPVGARLALAARALAYGEKIEYSGPLYESMSAGGNKITLKFTHFGKGLLAKDGPLKGFTIAGADKNFVPAEAKIVGNTVVVSSDQIPAPKAVRYGWSNVPDVNLFNLEGLPASPFRTDVE